MALPPPKVRRTARQPRAFKVRTLRPIPSPAARPARARDSGSIVRRLLTELRGLRVLPAGATLVLGVSGGSDSMAMLVVLSELARRRDTGWRLHVAHLDHGIQPRSIARADMRMLQSTCKKLDWPLVSESADVPAKSRARARSIETAARDCRYEFLARTARSLSAAAVLVAHTADDQAETVLHHLLRGTAWHGLAGMRPARLLEEPGGPLLVRPMLAFRRDELRRFLSERGIEYREDRTNRDVAHTRNRIRRELLPLLRRRFNPQVDAALIRLARHARDAADMIVAAADAFLDAQSSAAAGGLVQFDAARFAELPRPIRGEAIRQALTRAGHGLVGIGLERLDAAVTMLERGRGGRSIQIPGGATVVRRGPRIDVRSAFRSPRGRGAAR